MDPAAARLLQRIVCTKPHSSRCAGQEDEWMGLGLSSPKVSLETQMGNHLAKEPRDSVDNPESLGDVRVVCEGLGVI